MSERKFNFVSPGVYINEIDNSQIVRSPGDIGAVVIGRTERGPAMRPVKVSSFSEFVEIFGNPIAGGAATDVYRNGNYTAPTYASYAAQAWLRNNNACTVVRLLGMEHTNKTSNGKAGWQTTMIGDSQAGANGHLGAGGAYGLFIIDSDSLSAATVTGHAINPGVLAAVIYTNSGSAVQLSGTLNGGTTRRSVGAAPIKSENAASQFVVVITGSGGTSEKFTVNFDDTSSNYIRNVLNTNPTLTNSDITTNTQTYWLGETYEQMVDRYVTSTGAGNQLGFIFPLGNTTTGFSANHRYGSVPARSGWVFAQDLGNNSGTGSYDPNDQQKLFKFIGLVNGESDSKKFKVSIQDIRKSTNVSDPYGTFTVVVRLSSDNDTAPRIVERFVNCNLNPNSPNYIAAKIGDTFSTWDDTKRSYRYYGTYPNLSKYIRVKMNDDIDSGGGNAALLPFGFVGAPRFVGFQLSGSNASGSFKDYETHGDSVSTFITGAYGFPSGLHVTDTDGNADAALTGITEGHSARFKMPAPLLRLSSSDGEVPSLKECYWGVTAARSDSNAFDPSYVDLVRSLGGVVPDSDGEQSGTGVEVSYYFTLDDIVAVGTAGSYSGSYFHRSGSRQDGTSFRGTATGDDLPTGAAASEYDVLLKKGLDRFTVDLHGGFDGLDIKQKEPFSNAAIGTNSGVSPRELNNYAFYSVKRAIDAIADPEVAEFNLMLAPGINDTGVTNHMLSVCEDRGDALAIIDLENDYTPNTENANSAEDRKGTVDGVVNSLEARAINSSYGCAYYPWVQIRDPQQGTYVWVPPSIAALGTFASSERSSELWFAPAGFRRGGLTDGAAGLPVVNVADRLTASDRDRLYSANINPIATFPSEGIVIFGQKTLQVTPSALDRINVRRLMLYVKKQISRFATQVLFDQNVQTTWNRFLSLALPFLRDVESRFGLDDYRVVLDETTTTPDLVDRNVMYAKIFLKPTRAIEFIALDFVITNTGAGFAD